MYRHRAECVDLAAARRVLEKANRRDAEALRRYLRTATVSRDHARAQALDLVHRHWSRLERIAEELMDRHRLSGSRLRRLAGG
ncbi:hypothetical protein GCM10012275_53130 [Longimycelium tulufanense]|uniref:Uncharacterized protein n=1 Tax=Longimycelium tulufanense TaxID=907463 RepID=A0A8J3CJF3_9PSEU|nr:hypothetical protein [Longimycelium tulufanense]GGM75785.1 hypothetical protein GCM10012275_53130 [Longimycelium tulufanense]